MSGYPVVVVDGVLTKRGQVVPTAEPDLNGIRLAKALQREYGGVGYLSIVSGILVSDWLATYDAPAGLWVRQAIDKADTLAGILARRGDRAVLFVDSTAESFEALTQMKVPVLLYHSELWTGGDWRPPSSWSEPAQPLDDEYVHEIKDAAL